MTSKVIEPPKLEFFFQELNKTFGKFLVLRGYEFLPTGYSNDIDVFVPKDDLTRFFYCLYNLDGLDTKITGNFEYKRSRLEDSLIPSKKSS